MSTPSDTERPTSPQLNEIRDTERPKMALLAVSLNPLWS